MVINITTLIIIFNFIFVLGQENKNFTVSHKEIINVGFKKKILLTYLSEQTTIIKNIKGDLFKKVFDSRKQEISFSLEVLEVDNKNNATKCKVLFEKSLSTNGDVMQSKYFVIGEPYIIVMTKNGFGLFFNDIEIQNTTVKKLLGEKLNLLPFNIFETIVKDVKVGEMIDDKKESLAGESLDLKDITTSSFLAGLEAVEENKKNNEMCAVVKKISQISGTFNKMPKSDKIYLVEYNRLERSAFGMASSRLYESYELIFKKTHIEGKIPGLIEGVEFITEKTNTLETKITFK